MHKPKIFIAGHKGMVGSALIRQLKDQDVEIITKDRKELDLLCQYDVQNFFKNEKIPRKHASRSTRTNSWLLNLFTALPTSLRTYTAGNLPLVHSYAGASLS